MKKILIVSLYKKMGIYYKNHLEKIFGNFADIDYHYLEGNLKNIELDADLIVATSHIIYNHIENINSKNIETLIIDRTFTKEGIKKLNELNSNDNAIFVSTFYELAFESVSTIYSLGVQGINIIPYNPCLSDNIDEGKMKIAITAGETELVPEYIETIIDMGNRIIDLNTIMNISDKLNIPSKEIHRIMYEYREYAASPNQGLKKMIDESSKAKKELHVISSIIPDSIIGIDIDGFITEYNDASEKLFNLKKREVMGRKIYDVFDAFYLITNENPMEVRTNILLEINNIHIVSNRYPLIVSDKLVGYIFISKKYMEIENEQARIRSKLIPSGHIAEKNFNHILGTSEKIKELKGITKKMSKTDMNILITGETGTGKEVFAQSIHNESSRNIYPFVAINCATLNHNLLESELFGYEEGAFTGAKKGGKIGLFEMANGGTIFLDEIGEMPTDLQAKLLRVLDEKQVMRIGGTNLIEVDTRIIAATNRNLPNEIDEGNFREDLYYRINVFSIEIPALRERKEDICILAEFFLEELGNRKKITSKAKSILINYNWPGNVRELKNCCEYMYYLSDDIISDKNLPPYIKEYLMVNEEKYNNVVQINNLDIDEKAILNILYIYYKRDLTVGRKKIYEEISKIREPISEQNISYILKQLERKGLVVVNIGRKGSEITKEGIRVVENDNM